MNENIDLTKILKDCPEGFKLYTPLLGDVEFGGIQNDNETFPIRVNEGNVRFKVRIVDFTKEGYYFKGKGECLLFPSKDQRDWSKFTAPWLKKKKFNPKTLHPFDKVLARDLDTDAGWICSFFSHYRNGGLYPFVCVGDAYSVCIPYNDDTECLVGTKDEPSEFYKYWDE